MKMKLLSLAILGSLALPALAKDVTILHTNDIHAHLTPFKAPYVSKDRLVGGFANITTFVKEEKAQNDATFFFDAGDYFSGPYVSTLTQGKAIVDTMNTMGYDAASIGNHEFDHGWDNTLVQLSKATFPVLLGNVFYENSDVPFWNKPYQIIEKDGVKLGVIGLHGVFAFNDTVAAKMRVGIEARDEIAFAQKYIDEIRDSVDITVLLIHQGTPARQSSYGASDVTRALNKDIETAKLLKNLDVLVTGHAHVGTPEPIVVNDTLIVSTDSAGINVGKLTLDFNEKTRDIDGHTFSLNTIYADEWKADAGTQAVIDGWYKKLDEITAQKIGHSPVTLSRSYGESSPLGNMVADAMLAVDENAVAAFTNSGGIRNDIAQGDITIGNVISAFPFPNAMVTMTIKGGDLLTLLNHAANLSNGVMQVSHGMDMVYDSSKPAGERLVSASINGKAITTDALYPIVTNTFLADGGDGFSQFLNGQNAKEMPGYYVSDAVTDYLKITKLDSNKITPLRVKDTAQR